MGTKHELAEYPEDEVVISSVQDEWGQLYAAVAHHAAVKRLVDKDETNLSVDWGSRPVGLWLPSDWHIGSDWCDYHQLLNDVNYAAGFKRDYPGAMRLAHLGDPIDGYLVGLGAAAGGLYEETETRPDRQEGLFLWLAEKVAPWEVLLYGCHEAWTLTKAGRDPMANLAPKLGAMNGGYGTVLRAKVGAETYTVVLRHKTQGESKVNTTNAHRSLDDDAELDGQRADAICLSHLHNNDLQVRGKAGRRVVYTRSGAYKGGDCFARAGGYTLHKGADVGAPLLVFYPDVHEVVPFHGAHWREGLDFLARLLSNRAEV